MYPAGEQGIAVRRVQVREGFTVRVLDAGPREGFPVVLIHGWAGSAYSFAEMIPALVAAGYRVIALDLPGHGLSDKPSDSRDYTVAGLTNAVGAVVRSSNIGRYAVVAHSMAGAIALELTQRGGAPKGIVFIGAVGVGWVPVAMLMRLLTPSFIVGLLPALIGRPIAKFVAKLAFGSRSRPTERDVDEYWAPSQFDGFTRALVACLHRANWHREPREFLKKFDTPTLVIAGTRDAIVQGVAHGGRIIPRAEVLEVRGAGHLVMQESADVTNPAIVDFLSRVRLSPAAVEQRQ